MTMKQLFALFVLSMFVCGISYAADEKPMSQKEKMSACSKENKGKKGDEYKSAMSECLKKDSGPAAKSDKPMTQQQKMAACSKENKGKKGDEFKKAQKECLSK
jgi:hypothetical protein